MGETAVILSLTRDPRKHFFGKPQEFAISRHSANIRHMGYCAIRSALFGDHSEIASD